MLEGIPEWIAVTYLISVVITCAAVIYIDGEFGLEWSSRKERAHVRSEAGQ